MLRFPRDPVSMSVQEERRKGEQETDTVSFRQRWFPQKGGGGERGVAI